MRVSEIVVSFFLSFTLFGCTNNSISLNEATVKIEFNHLNTNKQLVLDKLIYTNAIGQTYSLKTVKYFISKITFHKSDGGSFANTDIHYVDIRDSETLVLELENKVPNGSYSGLSFVFGLVPEENTPGSLGIEMDRLMEWPESMGGGYHYMKLEGEYIHSDETKFFNFHTGGLAGNDYEVHIDLPDAAFSINEKSLIINLNMEISNWFQNPTNWDFNYWGPGIMGNPEAQSTIHTNGSDVFSVTFPEQTK